MSTIAHIPTTRTSLPYRVVCGEPDRTIAEALNRNPQPWFDEVMCHGRPDGVATPILGGKTVAITAEQLAAFIRAQPGFGRRPIRLLACWVGKDPNGFAQQLANLLRLPILAHPGEVLADTFAGLNQDEKFRMFWPE